jgi:SpoVK/Ycf46/Vps4 family AAA+-type ATPase
MGKKRKIEIITKDVKTLSDLIELGLLYNPYKLYDIDMYTLYRLVPSLTELNRMIGMNKIKQDMIDHILFRIQYLDHYHEMMMHTIIEGPPGVGKTEVAKIIAKIYLAMGILTDDIFIKATRSDLIAGYLGQTAIATQKIIDSAKGGVLFIDEVYSLGNEDKKDSFSKECIDTINENLTSLKTDFICIIAGYKEDIQNCFFAYNKGLERRFPIRFHIESYTADELFLIFKKKVREGNWDLDDDKYEPFFENHYKDFRFFGGDMEILFNNCKVSHSRRIFLTKDTPKLLRMKDIEKGFEHFIQHQKVKKEENELWKTMFM